MIESSIGKVDSIKNPLMKKKFSTRESTFRPQDFEAVLADPPAEVDVKDPWFRGVRQASTSVVAKAEALPLQILHPGCFSFVH
jgi:hypothetical protein